MNLNMSDAFEYYPKKMSDKLPYRLDIYEPLNRTSSRIEKVAAASSAPKIKIKNSTSSVYLSIRYLAKLSQINYYSLAINLEKLSDI